MPKIKRWFPIDQEINHKPKMRELMMEFKLAGLRIWLEILSIGDRADGLVDCTSLGAQKRLTSAAETKNIITSSVIEWLHNHGCLQLVDDQNHVSRILNYAEYHKNRGTEKAPVGKPTGSLPILSYPNLLKKKPEPVDNSKEELKVIFDLAAILAGDNRDKFTDVKNWIGKTIREAQSGVDKARPEFTRAIILRSLQALKKLGVGSPDKDGVFAYLTGAFKKIRTEEIQAEASKHKQDGIESAGEILKRMKGESK